MSRFMDKRSPAYAAAVEALLKLPLDHRSRAFADAAAPEMERNADRCSRRVTTGTRSWRRLLGQRGRWDDALPGDDHADLRLGAEPTYVSHPYQLDLDTLRAMVATCDAEGLTCLIHPWSSYFPSRTLAVEWRKAVPSIQVAPPPRAGQPEGDHPRAVVAAGQHCSRLATHWGTLPPLRTHGL